AQDHPSRRCSGSWRGRLHRDRGARGRGRGDRGRHRGAAWGPHHQQAGWSARGRGARRGDRSHHRSGDDPRSGLRTAGAPRGGRARERASGLYRGRDRTCADMPDPGRRVHRRLRQCRGQAPPRLPL
ncbi:MAG: hypothetical protein AVDCRST_MAG90-3404, partial [uncultured Microvirga sp.]